MKLIKLLLTVLSACSLALVEDSAKAEANAETGPYVMVTEGIVGGIVAPHVRQRTILIRKNDGYHVLVKRQAKRNAPVSYRAGRIDAKEFDGLMKQIEKAGLFELPLEKPRGGEDIYRLDTSIAVRKGEKFWRNGGPGGCVRLKSKVQPSEKQRKTFAKLVEQIKKFAAEHAGKDGDPKTFQAAVRKIQQDAPENAESNNADGES